MPDELSTSTLTAIVRELVHREEELTAEIAELRASLRPAPAQPPPIAKPPVTPISVADKQSNYQQLIARVRQVVGKTVPLGATMAVVSKGDSALLQIDGVNAWHFPQRDDGVYAGHHPADSAAAIAQLEKVKEKGADFLLIPQTSFWWLDHYPKFRDHLVSNCRQIARIEDTGVIFQIRERSTATEPNPVHGEYGRLCMQIRDFITSIIPKKSRISVISKGDPELVNFPCLEAEHFPMQEDGQYAGHYPADSDEVLAHLAAFRARGGGYLLIPKPSMWWLDFYTGFRDCLETQGRLISRQKYLGALFFLTAND